MPALEDTHDQGRSDLTIDLPEGPVHDRAILWAGALSASLHALLFTLMGVASLHTYSPRPVPEMRVLLEAADSGAAKHEVEAPLERPEKPVEAPPEALLASTAESHSVVARARPVPQAPSAAPTETPAAESSAPAEDSAPAATASIGPTHTDSPIEENPVVTTEGVSSREEPVRAAAAARPPGIALSRGQESALSRWIVQALQGLKDVSLTTARLSFQHKGRHYTARLERHAASDAMGIDHVSVEITTEENGRLLRTLLRLKRLALSHFTQFVDDWDPDDELHADAIEGRFHSNSEIQLLTDGVEPRVAGRLTTAAVRVNLHNGGSSALREIFRGGIETSTPRIALPAAFPASGRLPEANVRSFARATRVTFYPDGSYGWREMGSNAPEQRQTMSAPHYIVASAGATLSVRGTVKGTVVVYSPEKLVIEGNLVYAHDPSADPDAEDYVGLISNKDIEVAPPGLTGPGDLEIDAALYARRRFVVADYDPAGRHGGCPCAATLVIHGSLAAGSLSPTEPRYATRYAFDPRFEQVRPPGFPVTNRYEVESWDTQWREADAQGDVPTLNAPPAEPPSG
jgi:hypothetical protein